MVVALSVVVIVVGGRNGAGEAAAGILRELGGARLGGDVCGSDGGGGGDGTLRSNATKNE